MTRKILIMLLAAVFAASTPALLLAGGFEKGFEFKFKKDFEKEKKFDHKFMFEDMFEHEDMME